MLKFKKASKVVQKTLKNCQSVEFLPNLVTLLTFHYRQEELSG